MKIIKIVLVSLSCLALTAGAGGLSPVSSTGNVTANGAQALTNKDLTSGTNTFPTFNQNTSGSAATLTTPRTIGGSNFDGSANVTSFPAPGAIGGTTPSTGAFTTLTTTGLLTNYNGITTAGSGISFIVGAGRQPGVVNTGVSSICAFTPSADGDFEVSGNILQTASGISTAVQLQCAYTDEGGTSRTFSLGLTQLSGSVIASVTNNSQVPWHGLSAQIRAKGGTSITMKTAGTFTGTTYNVSAVIRQLQ